MALAGGSLYSTCVLRCCGAYFSLDAAPFSHCTVGPWLRFAAYPPCFLNMCTSLFKNTLELGIRRVYERQNAFWGVSNRISGQGQSVV